MQSGLYQAFSVDKNNFFWGEIGVLIILQFSDQKVINKNVLFVSLYFL